MACCGDTPTLEVLAAVSILREHLPDLKIRVVNVVDLMRLQPCAEHPHGLSETDYDSLFTRDRPIIFNFHGYPSLVHGLTYRRTNRNLHVRGYKEEGTITTAFDMRVQNDIDRFHLVQDVVDKLPRLGSKGAYLKQAMRDKLIEHKHYIDRAWRGFDGNPELAMGRAAINAGVTPRPGYLLPERRRIRPLARQRGRLRAVPASPSCDPSRTRTRANGGSSARCRSGRPFAGRRR